MSEKFPAHPIIKTPRLIGTEEYTYHDSNSLNATAAGGEFLLNRKNPLRMMKVVYQQFLTTCDLDSIANSSNYCMYMVQHVLCLSKRS